jgi:hypothetical protein
MSTATVTIPKAEYEQLKAAAAIPTYQLTGKAARDLDKLYDKAWSNYRAGKTRKIKSLAELD